jgi:hypothetical protein
VELDRREVRMMYELLRAACCFGGALIGTTIAQWLIVRSRLKFENRKLYAFIEAQGRAPDLGPHRSADVRLMVSVSPQEEDWCALDGTRHTKCVPRAGRLPPPPPTTVPGPGVNQDE